MKRFQFFAILILTICFAFSSLNNVSLADENDEARRAAVDNLEFYKNTIDPSIVNLDSKEEFSNVTIGDSIPVYRFQILKLLNYNYKEELSSMIQETNELHFAIISNGKAISRLALLKNGNNYNAAGIGGNGDLFEKGLPLLPEEGRKSAVLVKLGGAEFLYTKVSDEEWIVSVKHLQQDENEITPFKLYRAKEIIPALQKYVEKREGKSNKDSSFYVEGITGGHIPDKKDGKPSKSMSFSIVFLFVIIVAATSFFLYKKFKRTKNSS